MRTVAFKLLGAQEFPRVEELQGLLPHLPLHQAVSFVVDAETLYPGNL